jgi:hypothetical protein
MFLEEFVWPGGVSPAWAALDASLEEKRQREIRESFGDFAFHFSL